MPPVRTATDALLDSFAAEVTVLRRWMAEGAPQPRDLDAALEGILDRYRAHRSA